LPIIYQARCNRCTYASDVFPSEYGAVFVDKPPVGGYGTVVAGAVLHGAVGEAGIAEQADPRLLVLAHPIEDHILAETGYTWTGLALAGRYVRIRRVVCRDCGTLFEVRQLSCPPALGCQIGCLSGLVVCVVAGVWGRSFWLGFGVASGTVLGCMAVAGTVGWVYTQVRFRDRARELKGSRCCPRCNSDRYIGVESRRVFPCPQCSKRFMRIRAVGMS
jgi:hypothetical protein